MFSNFSNCAQMLGSMELPVIKYVLPLFFILQCRLQSNNSFNNFMLSMPFTWTRCQRSSGMKVQHSIEPYLRIRHVMDVHHRNITRTHINFHRNVLFLACMLRVRRPDSFSPRQNWLDGHLSTSGLFPIGTNSHSVGQYKS